MTLNKFIREINGKGVEPRVPDGKRKKPVSSNEDSKTSDFSTESDDDSDEFTIATLTKNKRAVQHTSKSSRASKGVALRIAGAKRANPVSEESCRKSAVRRSKRQLRKPRTLLSSLGDEENTSGTYEFFSKNTKTASGAVQKRTRESSSRSDDDMKEVAEALLHMSNGEVQTNSLSKAATEQQALAKSDDGQVPPAAGSGLAQDKQIEHEVSVCVINRNPSEFETEQAKKFMRRC